MNNASTPSGRLHALDNLRALMMWLGIVLHASINHLSGRSPLPWRDPQTASGIDLLMLFIHAFRMPVFFVLAGFFVALLAARRGAGAMLQNRARRLALPFVLFWPVLLVLTSVLAGVYIHLTQRGTVGLDRALVPAGGSPFNTLHLWFLYQLFWLSVLAWAVLRCVPMRLRAAAVRVVAPLAGLRWGFVLLALPLAGVGSLYAAGLITQSGSFLPPWTEWVQSGLFFAFGALLYPQRETLLPLLTQRWMSHALLGTACFAAALLLLRRPQAAFWTAYAYNAASWLWSLALIGGFLRALPRQNSLLRFMSRSAYWVYLVHMLGTIGFGILLFHAPLGAWSKLALNIAGTTALALVSYRLFVQGTALDRLLNGQPDAGEAAPPASSSTRKSMKARVLAARWREG